MSKNKQRPQQTSAAPVLEEKELNLLALQATNAVSMGFTVQTNKAGEPVTASKDEAVWATATSETAFADWVKSVMDASGAEKVETVSQGPQDEGPVGDLPENPNGAGESGGVKEEASGQKAGLLVEVDDKNEVVNVTRVDQQEAAVDLAADGVQLSAFQTRMAWIDAHGTTHEKYVKNVLVNYVSVGLTCVDLEKISVEQKRLWRLFAYMHAHPQEFLKLYAILIEFAREYRQELFNLHMFFRAQEGLAMGADEMQCFNQLRSLVLNTIESKSKQAVKALIDIRKIVSHDMIPEHVRGMYVAYYQ